MRNFKILTFGLILFVGCKEKTADFVYNDSKTSEIVKYEYSYKQGKKYSQTKKIDILMFGNIVTSVLSKSTYEYNNDGLLIKEITITSNDEKPELKYYNYDSRDSLILEIIINSEGDTSLIRQYANFPDGQHDIFERRLVINFDPNINIEIAKKHRTYDTVTLSKEYKYEDNKLKTYTLYDKNRKIKNIIDYEYKDNKIFKEAHYSILNNHKTLEETKHYDFTKNSILPEYFSLNKNNDTIEFKKLEFRDNEIAHSVLYVASINWTSEVFYKNAQKIGEVSIDNNSKTYYSFSYNKHGEIVEEKHYTEK
ncbi:MAG TPA: hypothetical protein VGC65_12360 [Bacteroidia bacterium]|jgi:hypothetical protein